MKLKFATLLLSIALFGPGALSQPNQNPNEAQYDGLLHQKGGMLFQEGHNTSMKPNDFDKDFDLELLKKPIEERDYQKTDIYPQKSHYLFTKWEGTDWIETYNNNARKVITHDELLRGDQHGKEKNSIWFMQGKEKLGEDGKPVMNKKGKPIMDMYVTPVDTNFGIAFNAMDPYVWDVDDQKFACIDRKSFAGDYEVFADTDGIKKPFNPKGPTGISGKSPRNRLYRLGVNHAADPVVMRKIDTDTFEVVVTIRKGDETVAIPGGFVDPGTTFGHTLLKELGEEAIGFDTAKWDALSEEEQTDELIAYMHKHFDILMLYKGYSDDPRNTDNMWIDTQAALFMDLSPGNEASMKFKTKAEDSEGSTSNTFWMTMKRGENGSWVPKFKEEGQRLYASHNFLLQDACTYADMCFNSDGEKLTQRVDSNGKCQRRRQAYKNAEAYAKQETSACQIKSREATCCLWTGDCSDAVKDGLSQEVRDAFKQAHADNDLMEFYEEHKGKWETACGEAPPATTPSTDDKKSGSSALGGNLFMLLVAVAVVLAMAL